LRAENLAPADGYTDTLGIMCDYYLGSECIHLSLALFLGARGEYKEIKGIGAQQQCKQEGAASLGGGKPYS
jgi:hypothetical protein